jgi:sortase A
MVSKLPHHQLRIISTAVIALLFGACLWQLTLAGWIQGKSIVAQQLLNHSWNRTIDSSMPHKPWPWADTWPVAKLIVPEYDIEQIVLAGDSGNSLAFGPGYSFAGAEPNSPGITIISGHRDTHFQFLKDLKVNDKIILQTAKEITHYMVDDLMIVDSKTFSLQADEVRQTLVLVTCYPFDAITPGGSLRYLVIAHIKSI